MRKKLESVVRSVAICALALSVSGCPSTLVRNDESVCNVFPAPYRFGTQEELDKTPDGQILWHYDYREEWEIKCLDKELTKKAMHRAIFRV